MRSASVVVMLALPAVLTAQQPERVSLDGREVAIYNIVGRMQVVGGSGDRVVVEVTRSGRDGSQLKLETGVVRGRSSLRVQYPSDRIYYAPMNWNGRSTFSISDDGTWGDGNRGRWDGRRIEVSSRGDGLDAHADLRVTVPKGKVLFIRHGIGETTVENVEGDLSVDVAASRVRVTHMKGSLSLDTGSGGVEVTDMTGDLTLDSGSGGAMLDGIRGGKLNMDIGSGSLRGRDIDVSELVGDVGSGGIRLSGVKTPLLRIEAGSGSTDVELLAPATDVSIEAGSGGVTLRMPASTNASVDIETGSGGIDTDFEVKLSRIERRALRGTIGTGTGRIRIESGSGSVRLMKS
jgi:hypothetical protein